MPFLNPRRAIVPAATLFLAVARAQTCYYPDGKTTSTDISCDPSAPASSCCGSDSFCLADGLCYGGGIVTRGSCTDKSWKSAACAQYCTHEDTSSEIAITPCTSGASSNTFACGLNSTACQSDSNTFTLSSDTSLVLRPAQIAALVGSSLQTSTSGSTATVTAIPSGYYSGGAMAGLGIGIALPLLIALAVVYVLLRRERNKFGHTKPSNKLMYKLPDGEEEADADELSHNSRTAHTTSTLQPPARRPINLTAAFQSNRSSHVSSVATDPRVSMRTIQTMSSPSRPVLSREFPPSHSQTFLERYETMKRAAAVQSMEVVPGLVAPGTPRSGTGSVPGTPGTQTPQELDSTEKGDKVRYELSDTRMST